MKVRAFAVWSLAGLILSLAAANPVYRALIALVALNVLLAARRADTSLRPLALGLAGACVIAIAVNLVIGHSGTHVLLRLPAALPVVGGPITLEAAAYGAETGLGIVAACLCVAPLALVIEPRQLPDAFPRLMRRSAGAIAGALELLPRLHRNAVAIGEAQRMRGWQPRGVRSWAEVIVPVVVGAVEDSVERAEALEARGYGSGPTTTWAVRTWTRGDAAVILGSVVSLGAGLDEILRGAAPAWYPLPSLSPPPVDGVMLIACLLLMVPLLTWRR